ncbi:carboxyl-terminal processing protease [Deinobacterium chartae]|uniref:Carboxyl-terminal processing protease n=1 Tax=Deinobacterium chartae TaxID=521158 RepID=A0A841HZC0_9DEIO|nr:S41 family peptidase [Deinobacterium chartae]MBB6097085.1 carboxyl-terminal processing protease [Deinobacterium chartae]
MKRLLTLTACLVVLGLPARAASPALEVFDAMSRTLGAHYAGTSPVNRDELIQRYRGRLEELCSSRKDACSAEVAYPLIDLALIELGDPHTFLLRPSEVAHDDELYRGEFTWSLGWQLARVPELAGWVVTDLAEGGAAARAGIRRGDLVLERDLSPEARDALENGALPNQQPIPLTVQVARGGTARELTLRPRRARGPLMPSLRFVGSAAVLRIPTFSGSLDIAQNVHDLVRRAQLAGKTALIIDLRDNPGGLDVQCSSATTALIGRFSRTERARRLTLEAHLEAGQYLKARHPRTPGGARVGHLTYAIGRPALWTGPLAVLVNAQSASCSEFLATEVQRAQRGPVVGERTAGLANSLAGVYDLPGGAALQVTERLLSRSDGTTYPQTVWPDLEIADDLAELARSGRDVALERALEAVRK